jgi:hypothetical protein
MKVKLIGSDRALYPPGDDNNMGLCLLVKDLVYISQIVEEINYKIIKAFWIFFLLVHCHDWL